MKKKLINTLIVLGLILILSSCAESLPLDDCLDSENYGFFGGLWHGIIAPISFVLSIFFDDIAMYAVNNSGGWYDLGFVLGAGILFGGGGKASSK
ncbi:hypothetical protein SAMN04488519_10871 [Algoriphagus ornithinivorans]|uniref:Lipoprotein n=1 Tax=Algoriphagus ornithinivorans TaxID=226506 RepID=A0A1I5I5B6_9BACT|nr:hypothetical protein [Algoriphagus ornithinivorans]SFO55360.1 hypothetical protein SAMN04488519_10871 [Algoriphagus ornithinivorans]